MDFTSSTLFLALILAGLILHNSKPTTADDIGTNFFLKASKSVPRIGRRSMDYENYFLKASKSVPRIGRRRSLSPLTGIPLEFPLPKPSQATIPEVEKKGYHDNYFSESGQPNWSNIEKAFEEYPGFYLSDEPFRDSSVDTNPDLYWSRLKRDSEDV